MSDPMTDAIATTDADIEAFVSTVTPDEALCMAQRISALIHTLALEAANGDESGGETVAIIVSSALCNRLLVGAVGASVAHPSGTECGCADVAGFIRALVERIFLAAHASSGGES